MIYVRRLCKIMLSVLQVNCVYRYGRRRNRFEYEMEISLRRMKNLLCHVGFNRQWDWKSECASESLWSWLNKGFQFRSYVRSFVLYIQSPLSPQRSFTAFILCLLINLQDEHNRLKIAHHIPHICMHKWSVGHKNNLWL